MFATDIAARGLDFQALDWVVQLDCPESAASYIHRVGLCHEKLRKPFCGAPFWTHESHLFTDNPCFCFEMLF